MQKIQKMLVFTTQNAENGQKGVIVEHFEIFLHFSFEEQTFS